MRLTLSVLAILLAGCAPTMAPLAATATADDRQRAEICHARAIAEAEAAVPYIDTSKARSPKEWAWWEWALSPVIVAGELSKVPVFVAASPVWVPWWLIKVQRERRAVYQRDYAACMSEPQAAAEPAGEETTR